MRIFKRGDKPATVTESAPVLVDSFFDRLLRQQLSRKSDTSLALAVWAEVQPSDIANPATAM